MTQPPIQHDQLLSFIEAAKANGATDEFLYSLLRSQGWASTVLYRAFAQHYAARTGMQVPVRRGIVEGARDAFLHMLSFGTLGTWTVALGSLLFDFINLKVPDPVSFYRYTDNRYSVASNLASLIVAFPVYILVMRTVLIDMARYPEKLDSAIRRWLTWFALLIASSIVIGDLITFLNYFIRGELTLRFFLKVLVVGGLAGAVVTYYLASLRPAPAGEIE